MMLMLYSTQLVDILELRRDMPSQETRLHHEHNLHVTSEEAHRCHAVASTVRDAPSSREQRSTSQFSSRVYLIYYLSLIGSELNSAE